MAAITDLIKFLEQGYTLRSEPGNQTLIPSKVGKRIVFDLHTHETKSRPAKLQILTLGEVQRLSSLWEWSVVFLRRRGTDMQEYVVEDITAIEKAIEAGQPHTLFDDIPTQI